MHKTNYTYSTIEDLVHELNSLFDLSQDIVKSRKKLSKEPDHYLKEMMNQIPDLAERYTTLYKSNKWKVKEEKIDDYLISNLLGISHAAEEMSKSLGQEKHSFIDYSLFKPWEGYYATYRDYCNSLTILEGIGYELENRYKAKNQENKRWFQNSKFLFQLIAAITGILSLSFMPKLIDWVKGLFG